MNDEKAKVRAQFSKNPQSYVESITHAKADDLEKLVQWLSPEQSWVVLDVATGGGHVAKHVSPYVKQVFSTDLTKEMLENTSKNLKDLDNIFYVLADAEELPFLNHTFDAVTCRIAPHHFPHPSKFVSEVSRVLKPGGKMMLVDNVAPNDENLASYMNTFEQLRDYSHVKCLSTREWKQLFDDNDLVMQKEECRKKTYEYDSWVHRTTDTEEQQSKVRDFILSGSKEQLHYFQIKKQGECIHSLQIDESMFLCEKNS
ncbi:class I SAM-dependent methyltransferase [Salinibacillus xinjiangensis]|uniref:Methyltransferase domain-containing protein n=1 Tax=Salinibacillus xinjiangensis TaxID=1229268 RepID=A0A6G1X2Z0_9BACI|nr:class I SAM-dependent methyltransferase [Salinibacillus xinjiangensis]MRG85266.1 methyltransferase domain-containing protein [Salinibacillus xinjiangensis]